MSKVIEALLTELSDNLDGLNYVVSVGVWAIPPTQATSARACIRAALGPKAVIRLIVDTSAEEAIHDIEACLRYKGDGGHGPDRKFLRSRRFKEMMARLKKSLTGLAEQATEIASFSLLSGPFVPIFWDFSYLFLTPDGGVVLMGASSD